MDSTPNKYQRRPISCVNVQYIWSSVLSYGFHLWRSATAAAVVLVRDFHLSPSRTNTTHSPRWFQVHSRMLSENDVFGRPWGLWHPLILVTTDWTSPLCGKYVRSVTTFSCNARGSKPGCRRCSSFVVETFVCSLISEMRLKNSTVNARASLCTRPTTSRHCQWCNCHVSFRVRDCEFLPSIFNEKSVFMSSQFQCRFAWHSLLFSMTIEKNEIRSRTEEMFRDIKVRTSLWKTDQ